MPEEEIESLELDKLNAAPSTPKKTEPSESLQDTADEELPPQKKLGLTTRVLRILMDKGFIVSLCLGVLVAGLAYYFISFNKISSKTTDDLGLLGKITYSGSAPIGFKYTIQFKLLVPFTDVDEKRLLVEKLSKMRPELMALSQDPDVGKSLREKDMDAMKARVIAIASRITSVPLTELELPELTIE